MLDNKNNTVDLSTPEKIRDILQTALRNIGESENCALLDYPDYLNIGDHLIWLGTVFYLTDVLRTKINYAASIEDFSEELMEKQVGQAPIFLQGGGNLGDLWLKHQEFRERIISKYRNQPIIILPQTIYFKNQANLKRAANVFNSHPNLTIFTRDNYSYETACQQFHNCQIIKAPDMAFNLVNIPGLSFQVNEKSSILYHCRRDYKNFSNESLELPSLVVEDWVSYKWISRENPVNPKAWYWKRPDIARLLREVWQRGLSHPSEWLSRQIWQNFHPYTNKFNTIYNPSLSRHSWSLMHSGMYQLKQPRLIITNRMHGHILCLILNIPHIFLPGSYHKNKSFYETWTNQIPFCKLVEDASQIKKVTQEILANISD